MRSVREHLKEMHVANADHHHKMAACFKVMHESLRQLRGDVPDKLSEPFQSLTDVCGEALGHCLDAGAACVEAAKELNASNKVAGVRDDDIVPDRFYSVTPTDAPVHKAVPRYGAPSVDTSALPENLPEHFKKLLNAEAEQ